MVGRILSIEVMQSIQHHRAREHLTDPADRGADNSVQLVAYKDARVRVYVRSALLSALTNVTGIPELARRNRALEYELVCPLGV